MDRLKMLLNGISRDGLDEGVDTLDGSPDASPDALYVYQDMKNRQLVCHSTTTFINNSQNQDKNLEISNR